MTEATKTDGAKNAGPDGGAPQPLYATELGATELLAILYETPYFVAALILAFAIAVANLTVFRTTGLLELDRLAPPAAGAVMLIIGLPLIAWASSYYPKRVEIFSDRLRFRMIFRHREILFAEIEEILVMDDRETKRSFLTLRVLNLSASISNAVLVRKRKGMDWAFSPADRDEFLAKLKEAMEAHGLKPGGDQGDK